MEIKEKHKSAGKEIGIISRCAHKYFQQRLHHYSIGHAQIRTLHYIIRHNGISQKSLAEHLKLDKSSVTSQIERLEANGYITRSSNTKDSREKQLYITAKTEKIKTELVEIFSGWSDALLEGLSAEEKEQAFQILERIKENAIKALEMKRKVNG